jgi:hypothetical protein
MRLWIWYLSRLNSLNIHGTLLNHRAYSISWRYSTQWIVPESRYTGHATTVPESGYTVLPSTVTSHCLTTAPSAHFTNLVHWTHFGAVTRASQATSRREPNYPCAPREIRLRERFLGLWSLKIFSSKYICSHRHQSDFTRFFSLALSFCDEPM